MKINTNIANTSQPYTPARSAGGLPSRSKKPTHKPYFCVKREQAKLV